jgi:hypothetical protein
MVEMGFLWALPLNAILIETIKNALERPWNYENPYFNCEDNTVFQTIYILQLQMGFPEGKADLCCLLPLWLLQAPRICCFVMMFLGIENIHVPTIWCISQ